MPTAIRNDRPLYEIPMGLADIFAATGRGVVRGTLGLPGDLESLVRMGIGGEQKLPTSEDWNKKLPPLEPMIKHPNDIHPYDQLGMFYNLPIYGGAISTAGKGIKKLGGAIVGGETNLGRREFAKKAGAIGLGSTALAKAFKYLDDFEKVAPAAKEVDGISPLTKRVAMKTASKYKYNSLKEYNDALNSRTIDELSNSPNVGGGLSDDALEHLYQTRKSGIKVNLAKADEAAYNAEKDYINSSLSPEDEPYTVLHNFSPQAKAEMKQFKDDYMDTGYREHDKWNMLDSYLK